MRSWDCLLLKVVKLGLIVGFEIVENGPQNIAPFEIHFRGILGRAPLANPVHLPAFNPSRTIRKSSSATQELLPSSTTPALKQNHSFRLCQYFSQLVQTRSGNLESRAQLKARYG